MHGEKYFNSFFKQIEKIRVKGFFNIVGAGVINKICTLMASVMVVRLLAKDEYGEVSYVLNLISLIAIGSSLGMDNVVLQFGAETTDYKLKEKIFKTAFIIGTLCNGIVFAALFFIQYKRILLKKAALLLFLMFWNNYFSNIYRVLLKNKKYAVITNIHTIAFLIFTSLGAKYGKVDGYLLGYYLSYLAMILASLLFEGNIWKRISTAKIVGHEKREECIKYGIMVVMTNATSQILYYVDVLIVGIVAGDAVNVANYKTATIIPTALNAIPVLIIKFIYPYFAQNKNKKQWVLDKWKWLLVYTCPLYCIIGLFGIIFAEPVIKILFGVDYIESKQCYQVLMLSFVFSSTFRILSGNILTMLRKVKVNFVFSILEAMLNIILDTLLIYYFGSIGAAIATLLVVILSGILSTGYLIYYLKSER